MNKVKEIIKIAEIHAARIKQAIEHSRHFFPLNAEKLENIKLDDFLWIELLINRFGKLQDLIGSKLIDFFLEKNEELTDKLTMLDKINRLERLGIIEDAELWVKMRKVRNRIAHEYPDEPALMAEYLNEIFDLTPKLLDIFNILKERLGEDMPS